jgi:chemotaxis signal transduction protein
MSFSTDLVLAASDPDAQALELLPPDQRQQLLRFALGSQDTALLPLDQIKEITTVNAVEILPVPETPSCVLGLCNWRGEMLWLIDLEDLVGYPPLLHSQPAAAPVSILVIQVANQLLGIAVRQVNEIEPHDLQQLQPATPGLLPAGLQPFVLGTLPEDIVLDIAAITQCPLWQTHAE